MFSIYLLVDQTHPMCYDLIGGICKIILHCRCIQIKYILYFYFLIYWNNKLRRYLYFFRQMVLLHI